MMAAIKPGTRVVRGPDWQYGRQDRNEGYLGTVVYVPKTGSSDKKVTVIWDSGKELRYRAGLDGKYDLRVFDSAPTGTFHKGVTCNSCDEDDLKGIRWRCTVCRDFNLCTPCYMHDAHDISHSFVRIDSSSSKPWAVRARNFSRKIKAHGTFPGAEVMRGPDWSGRDEDGGSNQTGFVKQLVPWKQLYVRGGVEVEWTYTSLRKTYRLGGEGCVDVIYADYENVGGGGQYYPDHLPLVDVVSPGSVILKPSDKIRVNLTEQAFKQLQKNNQYGGWKDAMKQCLEETGTIVQIMDDEQVCKVQYEDSRTWFINRSALTRSHTFSIGESVKVITELNCVSDLQMGHGGWNDDMKVILGKIGQIERIDEDGDLTVQIGKSSWMLNPTSVTPVETSKDPSQFQAQAPIRKRLFTSVNDGLSRMLLSVRRSPQKNIAEAVDENDVAAVKAIIATSPNTIDQEFEGRTALQLACYQGYTDIIKALLDKKANINNTDKSGDSPLHYAVFGNEAESVKILLQYKAKVDIENKRSQTPLHIAVASGFDGCVALLVRAGCNPNSKDENGDTPMHDAIIQKEGQPGIRDCVLGCRKADFKTTNKDGFNVLHWAALNDENSALTLILRLKQSIVDVPMAQSDGFTALHIAATHDFVDIARTLITVGRCNINSLDSRQRTPLIISALQRKKRVLELLLKSGCNVDIQDENGNTALHAVHNRPDIPGSGNEEEGSESEIICALVEVNADTEIRNKAGLTPLDLVTDPMVKVFIKKLASNIKNSTQRKTQGGTLLPFTWDSMRGDSLKRVKLSLSEGTIVRQEYEQVEHKFKKTLPQVDIISIERVQNPYLWEIYALKRKNMEKTYGNGFATEVDLFHGTTPDLVGTICEQNFDFRLAGERVGAILGRGAYFAVEAKYSDTYARSDSNRHKFMFLVKVLAGKFTVGNANYKRPPPLEDGSGQLYDCVVDRMPTPRIYCVFDPNQYYPEYVIEYT